MHHAKRADKRSRALSQAHASTITDPAVFERELEAEVAALPGTIHTLIFSSELLASRRTPEALAQLKALLDRFCDGYRIVCYMRRQDQQLVSRYSTLIRGRRTASDPLDSGADGLDYAEILEAWEDVFGFAAIAPRIFERGELHGDDVVVDFLTSIGARHHQPDGAEPERNASLVPAAQELLRLLNEDDRLSQPQMVQVRRSAMQGFVNQRFAGPGRLPSRAAAIEHFAAYQASNEAVRRRWFPERQALFSDDFSRYAEAATPAPSEGEILKVATAVIGHLLEVIAKSPARPGAAAERGGKPGKRKPEGKQRRSPAERVSMKAARAERKRDPTARSAQGKTA